MLNALSSPCANGGYRRAPEVSRGDHPCQRRGATRSIQWLGLSNLHLLGHHFPRGTDMGRFKKVTAKTPEDAASEGLSSMAAFFKPVPRPAPAPPVNKRGRRAAVTRAGGRKAAPTVAPFIWPQPPTAA